MLMKISILMCSHNMLYYVSNKKMKYYSYVLLLLTPYTQHLIAIKLINIVITYLYSY